MQPPLPSSKNRCHQPGRTSQHFNTCSTLIPFTFTQNVKSWKLDLSQVTEANPTICRLTGFYFFSYRLPYQHFRGNIKGQLKFHTAHWLLHFIFFPTFLSVVHEALMTGLAFKYLVRKRNAFLTVSFHWRKMYMCNTTTTTKKKQFQDHVYGTPFSYMEKKVRLQYKIDKFRLHIPLKIPYWLDWGSELDCTVGRKSGDFLT